MLGILLSVFAMVGGVEAEHPASQPITGNPVPLLEVTGPGEVSQPVLLDGKTESGITVQAGTYVLRRESTEPAVTLAFHITTQDKGSLIVRCDDVMARPVAYEPGERWYRLRLPYSVAKHIQVTWPAAGVRWNEVKLFGRTPVQQPSTLPAPEPLRVKVDLPEGNPPATCEIPAGFMCNWFERGLTDGMTRPDRRQEFIATLKQFPARSIRYPGGSWSYGYPPCKEAVQEFVAAGMDQYAYGLRNLSYFGWASPEDYFRFCKDAGMIAWYELNPGFWYDPAKNKVGKTIAMDRSADKYSGDEIAAAVRQAVELARLAHSIDVPVVWEIGNEDYCYYTPATYARLCEAFMQGIRALDPQVKFAVCGDSHSWSDWSFADAFAAELAKRNVRNLEYSSQHLYMEGIWQPVGDKWVPRPWGTPADVALSAATSWPTIRPVFLNGPVRFRNAGVGRPKMAITEFNVFANAPAGDLEHSVGRALGEAEAVCAILPDVAALFFHDLIRSHPNESWYARLDYYPDNPPGHRYHWFPEGSAVSLVVPHGQGQIIHNQSGICISYHPESIYVTVVNRGETSREVMADLPAGRLDRSRPMEIRSFRAASLGCSFFDYHTATEQIQPPLEGQPWRLISPPTSVVGVRAHLRS